MTWRDALTSGLLMLVFAANVGLSAPGAERPPNEVFIFADDLGYGDVGAFTPRAISSRAFVAPIRILQQCL